MWTLSVLLAVWIVAAWPRSIPVASIPSTSTPANPTNPSSPATVSTGQAGTPTPTSARTISAHQMRERLTEALDRHLRNRPGQLSLSIRDQATGFAFTYRPGARTVTASIVKVEILIALLLKAQREARHLTATERGLATQMIEFSDNEAANALWYATGGSAGLAAVNERLRLTSTSPGPGGFWGATRTSAADQIRVLHALTSTHSPLSANSRRYVLDLMSRVTPDQVWGVSAAVAADTDDTDDTDHADDAVALKNGWLPRAVDGGRWTINSIGRVRGDGHDYLIAVLSKLTPSMEAGVETVEHATRLVTSTLRKGT